MLLPSYDLHLCLGISSHQLDVSSVPSNLARALSACKNGAMHEGVSLLQLALDNGSHLLTCSRMRTGLNSTLPTFVRFLGASQHLLESERGWSYRLDGLARFKLSFFLAENELLSHVLIGIILKDMLF